MRRITAALLLVAAVIAYATLPSSAPPLLASTEHCFRSTHAPITLHEFGDTGSITLATSCTVPHSGVNGLSDWRVDWGDGTVDYTPSFNASDESVGVGCYNDSTNGRLCFPCSECPLIGRHRYDFTGVYTVNVYYQAGCCVEHQTSFTVTVLGLDPANLDPFTTGGEGTPFSVAAVENAPFGGVVAVFTGTGPITDFSAAIDWGDGTPTTTGAIIAAKYGCDNYGCNDAYQVEGTHLYSGPVGRTYTVTTTVSDRNAGHVNITTRLSIQDAPLSASPLSFDAVALRPFSGAVAGFTDADPLGAAGKYTATVDWGDGTGSDTSATIAAAGSGFTVNGRHTYSLGGAYTLSVAIKDRDGATDSVNTSIARVTNPVPSITSVSPGAIKAGGNAFTLTVDGADFVQGVRVLWNGVALPVETTTRLSTTRLTALVPDANFATAKTAQVTVVSPQPGGGASTIYPFFVTAAATAVTSVDTATSTSATGDASVSIGGSGPATSGSIGVGGHAGAGTVAVARYAGNPGGTPSFRTGAANGAYFDVYVAPGSTFDSVTIVDCALGGGSKAYWWNGSAWVAASNQSYDPATGCATITVTGATVPTLAQLAGTAFGVGNEPPRLTIPGDQMAVYNEPLARPLDLSAADIEPGDHLSFSAAGLPSGLTLRDNGDRTARVTGTPAAPAGVYHVTFSVSDGVNEAVAKSLDITITKQVATLSAGTATQLIAQGRSALLTAALTEGGRAPISGRAVTLTLSGDGGGQSCTGITDGSGAVSCALASASAPLGPQTITVSFAGDGYYLPASGKRDALVFAYLSGGAFVLGDRTVASAASSTAVTWWADTWSSLNDLSGGAAPASFKGFAAGAATPPACGTSWTSRPGNSAKPPGTVPAYMAVAVTDAVTSSGSTISGAINAIVIVKTNPGYGPDPGKPGTGTVVATLCSS